MSKRPLRPLHITGLKGHPGSYAALEVMGMTTDPRSPAQANAIEEEA